MDWTVSDLMLFGTDVDEFRLERNLKPEKVVQRSAEIQIFMQKLTIYILSFFCTHFIQSLDEIEKLCVDEKLPLFERAVLLADSNYDVQKAWVIDQLPVLLEINRQAVIEKILPKISVSLIIIAISSVLQLNGLLVTMSLQDKEELQLNSQKTSRNAMNSLKTSRNALLLKSGNY